ncbi:MAG: response regulator [Colwellia sp.]|nr:response regulator [Colwellia sp.]
MRYKVLLANNDVDIHSDVRNALSSSYQIFCFTSPHKALQELDVLMPDLIILDTDFTDKDGFSLCKEIKANPLFKNTPVVFLSLSADQDNILKSYEVGACEFLAQSQITKLLLAKVKLHQKLSTDRLQLMQQVQETHAMAMQAMQGTSTLGQVIRFIEQSYGINQIETLAHRLFSLLGTLSLKSCFLTCIDNQEYFFGDEGEVKPLEKQLLYNTISNGRFIDTGCQTLVIFPHIKLLIKNMPLDDEKSYGEMKDLLPVIAGAVNAKIEAIEEQTIAVGHAKKLTDSFQSIKESLVNLASNLNDNSQKCILHLSRMYLDLQESLPGLALEYEQEEVILDLAKNTMGKLTNRLNNTAEINHKLAKVLLTMQGLVNEQNNAVDQIQKDLLSQATVNELEISNEDNSYDDVELF